MELLPGTFRLTRNRDNDYAVDREMQRTFNFTGLPNNRVQDSAITESMGTVVEREQEHLGTSDIAVIFMRRLLARVTLALEQGVEPPMLAHPELSYVLPLDLDSDEPDLARLWRANRDAEPARTTSP